MEIITGIIFSVIGVLVIIWAIAKSEVVFKILGVVVLILGMCWILFNTETDDYKKWVDTNENGFILQIDGEYVLDNGSEYLFKILEYTDTGEKKKKFYILKKMKIFLSNMLKSMMKQHFLPNMKERTKIFLDLAIILSKQNMFSIFLQNKLFSKKGIRKNSFFGVYLMAFNNL